MVRADAVTEHHAPSLDPGRGRVVVAHANSTRSDALCRCLEQDAQTVRLLNINRTFVTTACRFEPGVVVLVHEPGAFDLDRICRQLSARSTARIVVVAEPERGGSVDDQDRFVISTLDAGADDFIWMPASDRVVRARIRAALRSRPVTEAARKEIVVGDVVIDGEAHVVALGGTATSFPRLQFGLLSILARQPGLVVTQEQLVNELWGCTAATFNQRRLRVAISHLRNLLGSAPQRPVVERVAHLGYRLTVPQ